MRVRRAGALIRVAVGLMSRSLALVALSAALVAPAAAQRLLVPMDGAQTNHLKAYGLAYLALEQGRTVEWLLNYRHGSFLLPDEPGLRREAALRGVAVEQAAAAEVERVLAEVEGSNREVVVLDKAPEVAVYTPPNAAPWDDAVTLALDYAGIPYAKVWDREVLTGGLAQYDWLHLHHEDFTGQYSKFFNNYTGAPWLQEAVARNEAMAAELGAPNVPALKKRVAEAIRSYVVAGGFLFAMCAATETLELALAARAVDIAAPFADGTPADPAASRKVDWSRTLAFTDAELQLDPGVSAFSDIDGHQVNTARREPLGTYSLFDFSAKFDPVPAMLVQNHESVIRDFYGLTTSFRKDRLKPGVTVLAEETGSPWAKYIHGALGEGTWTFLAGHDPEDPEHAVGAAPTDLALHPDSPGYRLILNNVLFPAARKKTLKTE